MSDVYDILILGGACAGYTAGIYASRGNLKVLCFEGWQPGGQLTTTTVIENYPGFKDGIDGKELMAAMRAQAERFGTQYVPEDVTKVDFGNRPFKVYAGDTEYQGRSVIIATGAKARMLGLSSEKRLFAKGVSTCATCDGFFFRDKTVAVIGGGDSAMEEASFLTKHASKVYVIHRRDAFRASKIMLDRARKNEKIEFKLNQIVEEVLGDTQVTGLRLKDTQSGETSDLPLDGMFLSIGHDPSTQFLKESGVRLDDAGYIVHDTGKQPHQTMTHVEGVFAAGDCVDHRYRQAVTAAGMGCAAAMDAEKWLESSNE